MSKRWYVEKAKKESKIIDIAVPNDVRVGNKEQEKVYLASKKARKGVSRLT